MTAVAAVNMGVTRVIAKGSADREYRSAPGRIDMHHSVRTPFGKHEYKKCRRDNASDHLLQFCSSSVHAPIITHAAFRVQNLPSLDLLRRMYFM